MSGSGARSGKPKDMATFWNLPLRLSRSYVDAELTAVASAKPLFFRLRV